MKTNTNNDDLHPMVTAVCRAMNTIRRHIRRVDPGHIQMIKYMERTANKLEAIATDLQARIDKESGE